MFIWTIGDMIGVMVVVITLLIGLFVYIDAWRRK